MQDKIIDDNGIILRSEIISHTVQDTPCPKCKEKTLVSNKDIGGLDEYYISCTNTTCTFFSPWDSFRSSLKI